MNLPAVHRIVVCYSFSSLFFLAISKPPLDRTREGITSKSLSTTPDSKALTTPPTIRPTRKVPESVGCKLLSSVPFIRFTLYSAYENQSSSIARLTCASYSFLLFSYPGAESLARQPAQDIDRKVGHLGYRRAPFQGSAHSLTKRKSSAPLPFSDHSSTMSTSDCKPVIPYPTMLLIGFQTLKK